MKKKVLALFAVCSMITTVSAGVVQTAYAADPTVRIDVSDGASDTQKILTFYYEGVDELLDIQGTLTFSGGAVSIDSYTITIDCDNSQANKNTGVLYFTSDYGTSSNDGSFATATITVPGDVDITANFAVKDFEDTNWDNYGSDIGTVSVTIPKKAFEPEETYYNKGYVFTSSADTVAKTYTKLTINVIDTADENKPGYAEVDLTDKLPTVSGAGEFSLFIKNIPTAYEVTSVELD